MAHRNSSSQPPSPSKPRHVAPTRRAHKRRVREDVLQHELELREHSPNRAPAHAPRVQQKVRAPFWKKVRRAVGVLAVLGLLELGAASLTAKPFRVKSLDVAGCELTDQKQVEELSQPLIGQNWIRANTKNIKSQIEEIPTVKSARVSRTLDWPPRLHVQVEERVAFARVGAGENWWVVDESGTAFRRAEKNDAKLYAVTSPKFAPQIGSALPEKLWRPAVEIADALNAQSAQSWSLRRIYFDKDGSAALRLAGGFHDETLVRLGSDHWGEKLARARAALAFFEREGKRAAVLNLVSYETPQWTPRGPDKSTSEAISSAFKPVIKPASKPAADTASET